METVEFRVPSGDLLRYECTSGKPVDYISTSIALASRSERRGFQAGRRGHFESLLVDRERGTGSIQYQVPWVAGLTFQVATYPNYPVTLAGLIGQNFEITHTFSGSGISRSTIESYFSDFTFTETEEGITVRAPFEYTYAGESTVLTALGGGVLDIPDGLSALGRIPKGQGAVTSGGGEIWIVGDYPEGVDVLVGYESAIARCFIVGEENERQRVLNWLDSITLSWMFAE